METAGSHEVTPARREMVLARTLDAPRRLVFEAWSRPEHLSRWWGPHGFTVPRCEVDFRPGGAFLLVMRGPDGQEYPFPGVYREIVPPERIVLAGRVAGEDILTTVTFVERGGRTELTIRQTVPSIPEYARGQEQGWTQSLEKLAAQLGRG